MKKERLEKKLDEISQILVANKRNEIEIGVLSGLSGISLFHFYYSKYIGDEDAFDEGMKLLEMCEEKINKNDFRLTHCVGISGFGWVLEHLYKEGFLEGEEGLPIEIDNYLYGIMILEMEKGNYDFLHGSLGYAYYFLMKFKRTKNRELKNRYRQILLDFLSSLNKIAIEIDETKLAWESIIRINDKDEKVYNLGLSHGIPSIIGILSKLYEFDDFKEASYQMLKGAIEYVKGTKNLERNSLSLFPLWIKTNSEKITRGRLAWCYGDLGIGIKLWYASKALSDNELMNESLEIMEHSARRTDFKNTLVKDVGICHGSFGNALIFQRIYKETRKAIFKEAAYFWIEDGLEKGNYKDGYAGFKQMKINGETYNDTSLLEGVAGIGLTIINYLTNDSKNWDECLLIS
ncbi:lanthionine synthetase C family protein [Tenacibaculum aiptasiae]|uniref:lanthionine synthetase C family protein n=1 Tax=Tenacibaculum aiptasiae TaxID=426481 RepID=UPI00158827FC|nr:lanthionine synthetase C family protein [Tenacibaculum aiptasiae]